MENETEKRQRIVYQLSLGSAISMLILVFVVNLLHMYIRWNINKDFTLLGGFELEALTIAGTSLLGLLFWSRR